MTENCTLQLHAEGVWHDFAGVSRFGPEQDGWKAKTYSGYAVDWAVEHAGANDAHAACANWPVGFEPLEEVHWPVFLIDMLPQGFGRQELLRRIGVPPAAGVGADWRLLLAGAGNPIGNLHVKEAADWPAGNASPLHGFIDDEVAQRGDAFSEHLASHGLFIAGSSGVQGEWPKILLTRADDGLLYLDHTLPDPRATEHFIVKFGRGTDPQRFCCSSAYRLWWADDGSPDEDDERRTEQGCRATALPAGSHAAVRALVCGVSAEPAQP